jgi:hypothetical protein
MRSAVDMKSAVSLGLSPATTLKLSQVAMTIQDTEKTVARINQTTWCL